MHPVSKSLLHCLIAAGVLCAPMVASAKAATLPDFSGLWGRNAFNFEPMATGPRPVTNLERLRDGTGNPSKLVGDFANPILKLQAAEAVKRLGAQARSGDAYPDPSNQCRPYAPPFTFAMELGLQMLQARDHVTILYNQDDQVRRVWLNRGHPAHVTPTPMGDSIGHYEGDTLVVDTIGVAMEPKALAMIDRYGTPRSPSLHVVERYRLIDGKTAKEQAERQIREDGPMGLAGAVLVDPSYEGSGLQLTFTVEDPEVFTTPWSAVVTYRRIIGPWLEQICADSVQDYLAGHAPLMPVADRPDF